MNDEDPNKEPDYDFLIEIVEDVEAFIGDDGESYGPYSQGQVVNVPKSAAKAFDILLNNGFAKAYHIAPEHVWVNPLFDYALKYFSLGFSVLPLGVKGKRAVVAWKKYETEKMNINDIDEWWSKWPDANIGIITGTINKLLVLDVDGDEGRQSLKIASNNVPINTVTARSSRGKHYYFREERAFSSYIGFLPGMDIRCEGALIVAPPSIHASGKVYEWERSIFDYDLENTPAWLSEILIEKETEKKAKEEARLGGIPIGRRNAELTRISGILRNKGLSPEAVRDTISRINKTQCDEPLGQDEVDRITTNFPKNAFANTDLGNAERLIYHFGDVIRYCHLWKKWIVWDGKRWLKDDSGAVYRLAKDTVRSINAEAAIEGDYTKKAELAKWAFLSESSYRMEAIVKLATNEIPISPDDLDQDVWFLNVENGIIDLRTGEFSEDHLKEKFITKLASVRYDPEAECPMWEEFLHEIFEGNLELIDYIQKAIGYSMTSDDREQVLFFLHGLGQNGKTTFLNIIMTLLGEYAKDADPSTFMDKKFDGGPKNDVARLKGARFVRSSEIAEGKYLDEDFIKRVTGHEGLTARFLYGEIFDFNPKFKLWMISNNKPTIRGSDFAIWRRLMTIPFNYRIPNDKRDKTLEAKLDSELPGILNWAIKGCMKWLSEGLNPPEIVVLANTEYKDEMDPLKDFLDDVCNVGVIAKIPAGELYAAYRTYCYCMRTEFISQQSFGRRLSQLGLKKSREFDGRYWEGIEINKARFEILQKSYKGEYPAN
jgi:putative DNA primase/helicase